MGTGKTSLTSIVIQKHLEELKPSAQERLAYFYCSEKEQAPTTSLEVLRSVLAQLSWSSDGLTVAEEVKNLYRSSNRLSGAGRPDHLQCVDLILLFASTCPKVTIIIDALDECADSWTLLTNLAKIDRKSGNNITFFFSSRMHVEVSKYFPRCSTVGPEGNSTDIERYIRNEMAIPDQRLLDGKHPDLEERLVQILIKRAENMYVIPSVTRNAQDLGDRALLPPVMDRVMNAVKFRLAAAGSDGLNSSSSCFSRPDIVSTGKTSRSDSMSWSRALEVEFPSSTTHMIQSTG